MQVYALSGIDPEKGNVPVVQIHLFGCDHRLG
jgi:hypothetical protein